MLIIVIPCFTMAEEDSGEDVLTYYYLKPMPDKVPHTLEKIISSDFLTKSESHNKIILAYTFGKIAQMDPSVIKGYEDIFEKTSHEGRVFILQIFQICGNEQIKEFLNTKLKDNKFNSEKESISKVVESGIPITLNPLEKNVKDATDLDLLWAEFMVSGNEKAIQKIIDVFEWDDLLRKKIDNYLMSSAPLNSKQEAVDILANEYGIKCNISKQEIETKDDLDIIIAAKLMQQKSKSEPFQKIKDTLNLTYDDILYMATKGSANWALNSNAIQHKKVFEICDREIPARTGRAKIGLLKIASHGYMSNNNIEKATEKLKELVILNPADAWAHASLGSIYLENKNINDAITEEKILQALNIDLALNLQNEIELVKLQELKIADAKEIKETPISTDFIKNVVNKCDGVKSYKTRLSFTDFTQKAKEKDYVTIEWDAEHISPDRFFVTQSAWEENDTVYDRWITIRKKHYFQIGGWFEEPPGEDTAWRSNTNKLLTLDKWIYIMQNNAATSTKDYQENGQQFIVLNFSPTELKDFWVANLAKKVIYIAEIWVGKESLLITKASLEIKGEDKKENKINCMYKQIFTGYDSDIKIEKPQEVFDLKTFEKK